MSGFPEEFLAAMATAQAAVAADEASRRITVDPVAHAVWTLLRNLQNAAEPTLESNERLLGTIAAVLAFIDGEGRRCPHGVTLDKFCTHFHKEPHA